MRYVVNAVVRAVFLFGAQIRAEYGEVKAAFVEWADAEEAMDYSRVKPAERATEAA